jgi:hypothetical protein
MNAHATRAAVAAVLGLVTVLAGCASDTPAGESISPASDPTDKTPLASTQASPPPPLGEEPPAEVLDLRAWKLQLPIPDPADGDALEISQPELSHYRNPPYFAATAAGDGVVLRAPVGGATTSGSIYPRSELREMTSDGDQASWSVADGNHRLLLTASVTHLPAVKPQVVVAQIKAEETAVIAVVADGNEGSRDGTIGLCLRYADVPQYPCLDTTYIPGTPFTLEIAADHGRIAASLDGQDRFAIDDNSEGCYFKTGAYTQSNPDKGDQPTEYGEVVIHKLHVSHT